MKENKESKETEMKTATALKQETAESKKLYNRLVGQMIREYSKVESSSLKIAFALHEIYEGKYYDFDGYKNIYDFGEDRFNLARGTVNNFINIIEKFALRGENGEILKGSESGLKPELEKFTFSKLCLLVSVPDEYLDEFYSSMTVREIRDKKVEIAKRIETETSSDLLSGNDDDSVKGSMNEPETGTSEMDSVDDTSVNNDEDVQKRCFVHLLTCGNLKELSDSLKTDSVMDMLSKQVEAICSGLADNLSVRVSIGLTYDN